MVGDGFGGRLWYSPTNYTTGSYSGYSICHDDSSQLYGWGSNFTNQLGLGIGILGVNVPTAIPNMTNTKYFSTGYIMGAIKNDNTGWAWGNGITGSPIQVITDAYFLDASSTTISFVKNNGTVWSIGDNSYGLFGDGTTTSSNSTPIQMQGINNAIRVSNSYYSTIILLSDSTLMAVGNNFGGTLGLGSSVLQTLTPIPITGLPPIVDIKSNFNGTIALTAGGDVFHWGLTSNNAPFNPNYLPVQVAGLSNIVAISACDDGYHFMTLDNNKNCFAWGDNWGQFGIPSTNLTIATPQLVETDVIDIMAGETFSYIVKSDGTLWGSGSSGGSGSIWLNLSNTTRLEFTQIDPSVVPEACPVVGGNVPSNTLSDDSDTTGIIFPNVFSPNNDGENDEFYFPNIGIEKINWQVYNRWGTLLFETNQLNETWDGRTVAGKECSEGTYYYIVNYKLADLDWKQAKGFITLIN